MERITWSIEVRTARERRGVRRRSWAISFVAEIICDTGGGVEEEGDGSMV